jgi:hypothetical protein
MVRMESTMLSTLSVRSVIASAFCVFDRYTSECFGQLQSTRGEGACGISPIYVGTLRLASVYAWRGCLWHIILLLTETMTVRSHPHVSAVQ